MFLENSAYNKRKANVIKYGVMLLVIMLLKKLYKELTGQNAVEPLVNM